jgi:hypothetical protein
LVGENTFTRRSLFESLSNLSGRRHGWRFAVRTSTAKELVAEIMARTWNERERAGCDDVVLKRIRGLCTVVMGVYEATRRPENVSCIEYVLTFESLLACEC